MCIRDRHGVFKPGEEVGDGVGQSGHDGMKWVAALRRPAGTVSYTHLTLPTSDLV